MTTCTTKRILQEAESRMTTPQSCGIPQAERDEITRVIKFIVAHNFEEAPPDADPCIVAEVHRLNDSV
jgi:hypothetical protein